MLHDTLSVFCFFSLPDTTGLGLVAFAISGRTGTGCDTMAYCNILMSFSFSREQVAQACGWSSTVTQLSSDTDSHIARAISFPRLLHKFPRAFRGFSFW